MMINKEKVIDICQRYDSNKNWEHVLKCKENSKLNISKKIKF